jgi:chaperonin GroES
MASPAFNGQKSLKDLLALDANAIASARVVRIERKEYFTKYGFIPAPDGTFYDIGFGTLTDNLGAAVNTIINQLIDAGTLSNMQGGFIAGGTKIKGGNMRFAPGEWKRVEGATAGPLRDNILPLQLPGPAPVLFQLLEMLIGAVQQITSVSDILSGNQESQTAPTTALALIEQGQKVFTAIYQRIHRALGWEIRIMRGLNRDYLDEQEYFALNDTPGVVGRADYEDSDLDIVPVSDPRAINDRVKIARAQVLMAHNGDPLVNQLEIRKRAFEASGIDNIPPLFEVPQPPPSPEAMVAIEQASNERQKARAEVRAKDAATAASLVQAATGAFQLGQAMGDATMAQFAAKMLSDAAALADAVFQATQEADDGGEQPADGPVDVPGMAGAPADGGLPAIPEGPAPDAGEGMGGRRAVDGGGSGEGGGIGGIG